MMFVLALTVFFSQGAAVMHQVKIEKGYATPTTTRKYDIEETEDSPGCMDSDIVMFTNVIESTAPVNTAAGEEFIMEFGDVFPHKVGNTIDLQVVSIKGYNATNASANGVRGGRFGNLNIASGVEATLEFRFIDRPTGNPSTPADKFFFSVFDIDMKCDETSQEKIQVPAALNFFRTATTHVVEDNSDETFHAESCGNETTNPAYGDDEDDNWGNSPSHPYSFTEDQLTKMVTFAMPAWHTWVVKIWISEGLRGRNIMFAGASNLVCPEHASDES